ncbi:T9SS type A sorting domain-containing protein [candidate division KSB1 bacterium]
MTQKKFVFIIVCIMMSTAIGATMMFATPDAEVTILHNGIKTVAIGETVTVTANEGDTTITAWLWTLEGPDSSAAVLDSLTAQSPSFIPDVVGVYTLTATVTNSEGTSAPEEMEVWAGSYVGVGTIDDQDADYATGQCGYACHADKVTLWETTEHADAFAVKLNETWPDEAYYSEASCLGCHTVGFNRADSTIANGGFADLMEQHDWSFPDTKAATNWDSMLVNYPEVAQMANIQCESCHGPGSGHKGMTEDNRISANITENSCVKCHEGGHQYDGWKNSEHGSDTEFRTYSGDRNCTACHTGAGFINRMDDDYNEDSVLGTNLGCQGCHDPHVEETDNPHQLRGLDDVGLGDMEEEDWFMTITFEEAGYGLMCMNCHKERGPAIPDVRGRDHVGPHHAPHTDMFYGVGGIEYGVDVVSSIAHTAVENTCVGCHMNEATSYRDAAYVTDAQADFVDATLTEDQVDELVENAYGHSMYNSYDMVAGTDTTTYDNLKPCLTCHPTATSFDEISFFAVDHDGDGETEGFREEIHGMMETLEARIVALVPGAEDIGDVEDEEETAEMYILMAMFNYLFVEEDKSFGVHNPKYTLTLINSANAILDAGPIASIGAVTVEDVPNDQGKQVRVGWEMFDGDPTQLKTYAVWREVETSMAKSSGKSAASAADFVDMYRQYKNNGTISFSVESSEYDFVAEVPAVENDYYSVVVPTLFDSTVTDGMHTTTFIVSGLSEISETEFSAEGTGYSVDNLVPATPAGMTFSVSGSDIVLEWEDAVDADFKHFVVYRSATSGFTPSETDRLGYSTDSEFTDDDAGSGSYYYVVSAVDFSGNEGDFSSEIAASVTGIGNMDLTPDKYGLAQNYPNPFNPETLISYQLPEAASVQLAIFNILGQEVRTLINAYETSGFKQIVWDSRDNSGNTVTPGVYIYKLQAGGFTAVKKMILLK